MLEVVGSILTQVRPQSNTLRQGTNPWLLPDCTEGGSIGGQNVQHFEICWRFNGVLSPGGNVRLVKSCEWLPQPVQDYKPITLPLLSSEWVKWKKMTCRQSQVWHALINLNSHGSYRLESEVHTLDIVKWLDIEFIELTCWGLPCFKCRKSIVMIYITSQLSIVYDYRLRESRCGMFLIR